MKRSTLGRQDTKLRQGAVARGARGMRSLLSLLVVALVLVYTSSAAAAAEGDCNPDRIAIGSIPDPVEYEPGVPFTIEMVPMDGDWPTTPTAFWWIYSENKYVILTSTEPVQEFTFPPPNEPVVYIRLTVTGPGIRPDCPEWWATSKHVEVRLKGYVEPTITLTPTPTPCPDICPGKLVHPQNAKANLPLDFIAECVPGTEILGIETISGSHWASLQQLSEGRYRVSNLLPNRAYILYFYCGQNCNDEPVIRFSFFDTGEEPHAGAAWLITGADGASSATLLLVGAEEPTPTTLLSPQATSDCIEQTDAEAPQ